MASAFGHALAGWTVSRFGRESALGRPGLRLGLVCIASAILPDADVIGFRFGIEYGDVFGHRGFTHSILFAACWATVATFLFFRASAQNFRVGLCIFVATLSHGLFDAMTNGGLGVGFFIPFENSRYFLPWTPIEVSPIGVAGFWSQAGRILGSEAVWIGVPCAGVLLGRRLLRVA
jgi:inner membrane protein